MNCGEDTLAKTAKVISQKVPNCISVIIPTLNEEEFIEKILNQLQAINLINQIIMVDGGSDDHTLKLAKNYEIEWIKSEAGRAKQMNVGARIAQNKILLFLHADVTLPTNFEEVLQQFLQSSFALGNFRLAFDDEHWWLKLQAIFSRLSASAFQFGDQGLLIRKELFDAIKGFDESFYILEDQDIIRRAKRVEGKFIKLPSTLRVSARKYLKHGRFKLQFIYFYLYFCYSMGDSQKSLKEKYLKLVSKSN